MPASPGAHIPRMANVLVPLQPTLHSILSSESFLLVLPTHRNYWWIQAGHVQVAQGRDPGQLRCLKLNSRFVKTWSSMKILLCSRVSYRNSRTLEIRVYFPESHFILTLDCAQIDEALNQGSISEGIKGKGLQIIRPRTTELALVSTYQYSIRLLSYPPISLPPSPLE